MKSLFGCRCEPKSRAGWYIIDYRCNYSAFNGYQRASSDYSAIACSTCKARWRTKAAYVDSLPMKAPPTPPMTDNNE